MTKLDIKKILAEDEDDLPDAHDLEYEEKTRELKRRKFEHDRVYKTVREREEDAEETQEG